jgi:hypothetical protein
MHNITWNSQLEKVISEEGEKCLSYSWLHDKSQKKFKSLNNWIAIPVIVLSTLSGAGSIGGASFFEDFKAGPYLIGFISICVGILNTIGSYFSFAELSEQHRISSIQYSKNYNVIKIELSLPREQRIQPQDFLKIIKEELDRLREISPEIPEEIISRYKIYFNDYTEVKKPEICNGLSNIEVYSPKIEEEVSKRMSCSLSPIIIIPKIEEEIKEEIKDEIKEEPKSKPLPPWK